MPEDTVKHVFKFPRGMAGDRQRRDIAENMTRQGMVYTENPQDDEFYLVAHKDHVLNDQLKSIFLRTEGI